MLAEEFTRLFLPEISMGPCLVMLVHEICTLKEIRNPADPAFGQRNLERVALKRLEMQPVGSRIDDRNRHRRNPGIDGRFHRRMRRLRPRSDMNVDDDVIVGTRLPKRLPVFIVDAGLPLHRRIVAKGDRVASLFGDPLDLGNRCLDIPIGHQGHRDVTTWMAAAPFVDMPVVIRLKQDQRILLVIELMEQRAIEADDAGKIKRGENAVGIHVFDPRIDIPCALTHLFEGNRLAAIFFLHPTDHGVQPDRSRPLALVKPVICAFSVLAKLGLDRLVLRRKMLVIHGGWLDDMVVDADNDEILDLHNIDPLPITDILLVLCLQQFCGGVKVLNAYRLTNSTSDFSRSQVASVIPWSRSSYLSTRPTGFLGNALRNSMNLGTAK